MIMSLIDYIAQFRKYFMIVIVPAQSIFSLKVHDFQSSFFQESAQLK